MSIYLNKVRMITIGIIGNGFVGNATSHFKNASIDILIYDISPDKCEPPGLTLSDLCLRSDCIFICLPTPMSPDGSCHLGIIEKVMKDMREFIDFNITPVVLRSTVPVGTCYELNCYFMPEFLTEAHASIDFKNTECWIFGLKNEAVHMYQNTKIKGIMESVLLINKKCGNIVSNEIKYVSTGEAEAIKLFKNTFLAMKVGFCNEFYRFCENNNVNYINVIEGVVRDKRITTSHTNVPGKNGKFGFGGTCFPKDISSLQYQMLLSEVDSPIVDAVIKRNNEIDRKEQEWKEDEGRAVVKL